jgi:phosphoglycolate phosphatase
VLEALAAGDRPLSVAAVLALVRRPGVTHPAPPMAQGVSRLVVLRCVAANLPNNQKPQRISVLVTDLDNTLWDWVHTWHSTFNALLTKVSEISGIPVERLEPEFKAVHQRHGTTEYAFSLQEMPSILRGSTVDEIKTKYAPAIAAFREARAATLQLYPGVAETLKTLRERGCLLVGYTESLAFYSLYRMRQLNVDLFLDYL